MEKDDFTVAADHTRSVNLSETAVMDNSRGQW